MGINQSICFGCFVRGGGSEPETVIKEAARTGYKSVEMLPQEHWNLVHDNGMEIATIVGHGSLPDGLNKRENHGRIEDELLSNIELAVANGIPSLITFSGNRERKSEEEGRDNCVEGLSRVAAAAEKANVTLCMELLNSKVNHPDYQCDTTPWGVQVCQGVNSSHVKLLYDIYHMQIMEGDLIRTMTNNLECIKHIQLADNPGRHEPGTGEINYSSIFSALQEIGYNGYVGCEYIPKVSTADGIGWIEQYRQ